MFKRCSCDKTKVVLAGSLRNLLQVKPFDKIKINDIVEDCGMNRQTFYYHFQDMYALLEWLYFNDCVQNVKKHYSDYGIDEAICYLLKYVDEHRGEIVNILDSKASDYFLDFVHNMLDNFFDMLIEEKRKGIRITVDFKSFLSRFFTNAVIGMLTERAKSSSLQVTIEENIVLFDSVFNGVLTTSLKNYSDLSNK